MKVECINIDRIRGTVPFYPGGILKLGAIYTVTGRATHTNGSPCYNLAETDNESFRPHFYVERFRPLTDISALTILTKVRELEDAA